ncbi:C2 domain-containing protein 2 [Hyla sarda]|uniref:C2 domain-containing protein 2 n=1 Tax=Hyla sarda TaxID=327740 RepID=UPI0024C33B58|nr:C2 domain-containing protein 2 [Hyla sarda]
MSWFGEFQWLCLVTLFFASLLTIAVYLVQYALNGWRKRKARSPYGGAQGEADTLLSWILSLNSWRSQWLKAWIAALNEEAGKRGVVCCSIVGDCLQFAVRVTRTLPANSGCQVYSVRIKPLHINLELRVKEGNGRDVQVTWSMGNFCDLDLQVQPKTNLETPGASAIKETLEDILKNLMGCVRPQVDLSSKSTNVKEYQNIPGIYSPVMCPPKPPRAHELKLQVRNIKAALAGNVDTSGMVVCSTQLNDPVQRFTTAAVQHSLSPSWEDEFVFELNAKSRELQLEISESGQPAGSPPLASTTVPLDLFRKNPSGRQNYSLHPNSPLSGSISAQFLFVEPNEMKSWTVPVPAKKVEKDRTVMPCGTVVTTVTSVTSKPRLEGKSEKTSDSPSRTPPKIKIIERDFSVQAIPSQTGVVSKALSSSDTELLMLNGSDPVAEAAIRQLRESSRQSLKSPRKKSTIIISGISKTVLTQDDEAALMLNYAASMDSTIQNDASFTFDDDSTMAAGDKGLTLASTATMPAMGSDDELHSAWEQDSQPGEWNVNGMEDQDSELVSVSNLSISETGSVRKSKGGLLHRGAKLFFRRRHQQKDPSMSQSHNDLVYLERQGAVEHRKKGATLSRFLNKNKKLLPKNKHKNKPQPDND